LEYVVIEEVYYSTTFGDIRGVLTINPSLILFDPHVAIKENTDKIQSNFTLKKNE